jgi:hypothetical protein
VSIPNRSSFRHVGRILAFCDLTSSMAVSRRQFRGIPALHGIKTASQAAFFPPSADLPPNATAPCPPCGDMRSSRTRQRNSSRNETDDTPCTYVTVFWTAHKPAPILRRTPILRNPPTRITGQNGINRAVGAGAAPIPWRADCVRTASMSHRYRRVRPSAKFHGNRPPGRQPPTRQPPSRQGSRRPGSRRARQPPGPARTGQPLKTRTGSGYRGLGVFADRASMRAGCGPAGAILLLAARCLGGARVLLPDGDDGGRSSVG